MSSENTSYHMMMIDSNLDMLTTYIKNCRKAHKKISFDKIKFYSAKVYDVAEQGRRFEKNLPIGRSGIDFIN